MAEPKKNYIHIAEGWRMSADSMQWTLERQTEGEKGSWATEGYATDLSHILSLFAQKRARQGVEAGGGLVDSVRVAARELAQLIAEIKEATRVQVSLAPDTEGVD